MTDQHRVGSRAPPARPEKQPDRAGAPGAAAESQTFAVLGAGNGGRAMAATLARRGHRVHLWNRTQANVRAIAELGGLYLEDETGRRSFAALARVTDDLGEALDGVSGVMVVVLHPGRSLGALEFRHVLHTQGNRSAVRVAEAQTLIYACRSNGPVDIKIFRTKYAIPVAALPATDTPAVLACLHHGFPQFVGAESVLQTSLDNMGAIFHPALTILNAGWIEATGGDFQFYVDGVTPAVARVLEALDRERVTVAAALGVQATPAMEWLDRAYRARGSSLHEAMHSNPGYAGIKAPSKLVHRYIFEEVPYSLVPIISLGRRYGVSCQVMDTIVRLASIIHGVTYERRGRTVESLGLERFSRDELRAYVTDGTLPETVVGARAVGPEAGDVSERSSG